MGLLLDAVLARSIDDRANDPEWLAFVDSHLDELESIVTGSADVGAEQALHAGAVIWRYLMIRGNWAEGIPYLDRVLAAASPTQGKAHVRVMYGAVLLTMCSGDDAELEARELACLELAEEIGDSRGIGDILNLIGGNRMDAQSDPDGVREMLEQSLAEYQSIGDEIGIAEARINLAEEARQGGDWASALAHNLEIIRIGRAHNNLMLLANTLGNTAGIYRSIGDLETARTTQIESLQVIRGYGFVHWKGYGLISAGGLLAELKAHVDAARIMSAGVAALPEPYTVLNGNDAAQLDADIARVKSAIGIRWFERAWLEGADLEAEQAIDEAIDLLQAIGSPDHK